jgi:hypothetical protein
LAAFCRSFPFVPFLGEPEAGAVAFTDLPAAEFLRPFLLFGEDALQKGGTFGVESEDA